MKLMSQEAQDELRVTRKVMFRGIAPCGLRIGHRTKGSAQQIAKLMSSHSPGDYREYHCPCCGSWHIGRLAQQHEHSADNREGAGAAPATPTKKVEPFHRVKRNPHGWDRRLS